MPAGPPSPGAALARRLAPRAWKHAHAAWEARSKGRHGEAAEEQAAKKKALALREAEVWCQLKEARKLQLAEDAEELVFHRDFGHHKEEEGALHQLRNWLSTWSATLRNSM